MLRNREFRRFAGLFTLLSAVTVILGFSINEAAGILAVSSAAAFGTAFYIFTKARYKSLARISDQIDLVLHNADHLYMGEAEEGELSILHSEITKMTLRLREQNEALRKEKEYLSNSLADIAHQLRTPLTSVNLILSLLRNSPDEKDRKAYVRETEELLIRMDWLITSLLKLSRLDAGIVVFQREQIEADNLIRTALRPFLIPMELHEISVQINVPKDMVIQGDPGWLSEAIQNIIKNCMESTGENGKIELGCTDNPLFTEIVIHDSGPGFAKEDLPCLFDRFYRGKSQNATGYGIGLALCKMIITRQGGTITAKNHSQGGAVFTIRFPK
ncbi:sensor histidine kinase [Anaerocolumna sp. MB42-C2]|uniref:sensor histidine kinase n=1 Tax=Anaerocolumna sp. MB42-C2 TaxID=3070997 RepID=UPI0027E0521D|nr:HAMP domain-containing sensor histidine kinase [Anaerocolumna sp. MB42-C2]WMJ89174.1 HAMP domain-containing sensor histidine kinase [Anaerocolumna sp. MB42-C2]